MEVRTKRTIEIWSTIGGLLAVGLLFAYCSSSSSVSVPKADKQASISAQANANSVTHETEANDIAVNVNKAEANTNSARKEYKAAVVKARKPVKVKKYEEIRNKHVVVSDRDLSGRKSKLLTDLRKLYWQEPK